MLTLSIKHYRVFGMSEKAVVLFSAYDISGFVTNSVTSMMGMFAYCSSLTELDLSSFVTNNVKEMKGMFSDCENLTKLDISSFDLQNLSSSSHFIYNCTALELIYSPYNVNCSIPLPGSKNDIWYRSDGTQVTELPQGLDHSVALGKNYIPQEKIPEKIVSEAQIVDLKEGESAVLVYDEATQLSIEGAQVVVDGTSYTTDAEGLVRFAAPDQAEKKQITVTASEYNEVVTYQKIESKDLIRIGMCLSDGTLQITGAVVSLGSEDYDVLREKLVLGYAKDFEDFSNVTENPLTLTIKSNKENVFYDIMLTSNYIPGNGSGGGGGFGPEDDRILFTSTDGKFTFDVVTESVKILGKEVAKTAVNNLIEPGKKVYVRATDADGNVAIQKLNVSSTYNYLTQENTEQKDKFKLGKKIEVSVPEDVPFIGGNEYEFGFKDEMPLEMEIDENGKIKIAFNKPADIDMDRFSKEYKALEKKVEHKLETLSGNTTFGAGMLDVSGKVCGYGEGNICEIMDGNPEIKLGIMAEIEGKAGYQQKWVIGVVPVKLFIEGKATGKISVEAGMKFENWKVKEFDYSGGSLNIKLQLEVGGGVGFGYEIEASLVGSINYDNKPARQYEKLWLEASGKVKRTLIWVFEKPLWESDDYKYVLYQKGKDAPVPYSYASMPVIGDETKNSEFALMGRTYLDYTNGYNESENAVGIMSYSAGNQSGKSIVKAAVLPSTSPTLLETENGKYLFWVDDIASRDVYNRTALMYAKSIDGINWSTPVQVLAESQDNTMDGSYDIFQNGSQLYLVWQDAGRQFSKQDDILDVLNSLSVRFAVLDTQKDIVTENMELTQTPGYYLYPSVVAAGEEVYFAYVHNMLDTGNVDGNNRQQLYVVKKEGERKAVSIPDNAQIVNMDAGIVGGNACLVCEMDTDGNASSDEDREIYLYDILADNLQRITDNTVVDTMPVIADSGSIYWFQNTDILRLSETSGTPKAIWNEPQLTYQTVFTVVTDSAGKDTLLWETADKEAEDGSVAIFQTSENDDGTWGEVVKFAETTGIISSRISAAGSGDGLQVAHTEGIYLEDGTALKDLCVTAKEPETDIALSYVTFDEENIMAGSPLMLTAEVINNGNTTIDEISASVDDSVITTLTDLDLRPSESRILEISGFYVPSSLGAVTDFTLQLSADGEKNLMDNAASFMLGGPDVSVETDSRISRERTWLDVSIWNKNPYETSGEVIVRKGAEDGEVIYREPYSGLGINTGYAYSFDLGDYEGENVKYYVEATTDTEEIKTGDNTEFVYIGYGTGIVEEDQGTGAQEISSISLNVKELSLGAGETSQLTVLDDSGNAFEQGLLWVSSDKRIASVDQNGFISAHRSGNAEITAYYGDLSCSCQVTVSGGIKERILTVWFDTQGGDTIEPIDGIASGSTIMLPKNVRKAGYLFAGWYTRPEDGEKIESEEISVDRSTTLYAHWISEQSETELWVESVPDQIYTGKAIKPQIKVYDGETLLNEKTDYTVSYKNNIKANDASDAKTAPTIIVKGKGNYSEKETVTFRILPVDLNNESVITSDIISAFNNKIQKKVPVVTYNGKKLIHKKDFTVSYPAEGADAYKAADTYDIVLTAKENGNFTGTRTVRLTIVNTALMSKVSMKKIPNQTYTGSGIEPKLTLTYNKKQLVQDKDYTVTYQNNILPGTATVIVTGMGDYAGTKTATFKITGYSLSKARVSGIENKVFSGESQEQQISVTLNDVLLTEGKDYEVLYANNINVGKASITIIGKDAYAGTLKKTFKITAYDIASDPEKQLDGLQSEITEKYMKGGSKPELTLTFAGKALVAGKDYTISYKNNNAVTTETTRNLPTVLVKGKGNFKGSLSKPFTILSKDLNDEEKPITLIVADKGYVNKAGQYISRPTLTDSDGKKLVAGKDYEKEIVYTLEDGTLLTKKDKVNAGINVKVIITGKGAYYGKLETTYRITEADFSKAKISISPQIYNGEDVLLSEKDITVKIGKTILLYGTDYEIVTDSYKNNKNKGTASVIIAGKGNYGGMKTSKFKIKAKGLSWFWRLFI